MWTLLGWLTVANPLTGILSDAGSFLVDEGAKLLGFDDERQVAISQEAVDLTNQMVDAGLIGKQYRVELLLPEDASKRTRQNTGIKGDEEVFNAVNHALFSYYAGQNPLAGAGAQAKEMIQGAQVKSRGGDPRTEGLDYFNNKFGIQLARQGASLQEAKNAIVNSIANVNNEGTRGRMLQGLSIRPGQDLLLNREDLPTDTLYPFRR
jgi:hypothetical protein